MALGSKYANRDSIPPSISAVREFYHILSQQFPINQFSHAKLTLLGNPDLKIGEKPFLGRVQTDGGILTLDQLIGQDGEVLPSAYLRSGFYLPAAAKWQYLQLQHLFIL